MKKKILAFTLSLVMAVGFSACGNQSADSQGSGRPESSGTPSDQSDAAQPSDSQESSDAQQPSEEGMTLTDWYDTEDRKTLETTINNMFASQGLTFFISVEEPDTVIYNYQYTDEFNLDGLSQEDIDTYFNSAMSSTAPTLVNDIATYKTAYGVPLTTIRMNYLNVDGSVVYSADIDENWEASAPSEDTPSSVGAYDCLQAWAESDEAALAAEATNEIIASTGLTVKFAADGNTLVYEYYASDALGLDSQSPEELATAFEPIVDQYRSSISSLFDEFENNYGFRLDGIRFVFYSEDGSKELFSSEIPNE